MRYFNSSLLQKKSRRFRLFFEKKVSNINCMSWFLESLLSDVFKTFSKSVGGIDYTLAFFSPSGPTSSVGVKADKCYLI